MTSEMAFEGLLVSQNSAVLTTMHRILDDFSIAINICVRPSKAIEQCTNQGVDLVVIDCEDQRLSSEIIRKSSEAPKKRRPTIMAIVGDSEALLWAKQAGAHLVVQKPITAELGMRSMKKVYSLMIRDYRRYARHAVLNSVTASLEDGRQIPVTVMDISEGGVGVLTKEDLEVGAVLIFPITLKSAERTIYVQARVAWKNSFGTAGAEFMNISGADLRTLRRWLWSRCHIKNSFVH
jgi:AmiR/NasT family two-component response regulator